jgi:hypothetical protein
MSNSREKELEEFRKSLEDTDQSDFDGHTNFEDLSVREKLIWLSELNYFRYIANKNK